MKLPLIILLLSTLAFGQDTPAIQQFHHCRIAGGSGNSPHLFDTSEIYRCDEGSIEINGQWNETIEYGYVYTFQLGRPSGEPRKATADDYRDNVWCSTPKQWDPNQKERCGDRPVKCFDGKQATWDPNWKGYSCATADHTGIKAHGGSKTSRFSNAVTGAAHRPNAGHNWVHDWDAQ